MEFNLFQNFINRIDAVFPDIKIYIDYTKQRRALPSISIDTIQASMRREIRGRFWIDFILKANYLPEDAADEFNINDIKFKMAYAIDRLPIEGRRFFQATKSDVKVVDRAIIGTAYYSVYFKEEQDAAEFMEHLKQEETTTEEAWEEREPKEETETVETDPGNEQIKIPSENNNPRANDETDLMGRLFRK